MKGWTCFVSYSALTDRLPLAASVVLEGRRAIETTGRQRERPSGSMSSEDCSANRTSLPLQGLVRNSNQENHIPPVMWMHPTDFLACSRLRATAPNPLASCRDGYRTPPCLMGANPENTRVPELIQGVNIASAIIH